MLENIPANEPEQIQHIADLTIQQLQMRYPGSQQVLRGVHAKSHGCVTASFEVLPDLAENLRHGVFEQPGRKYSALVRFSNAATNVAADSTPPTSDQPVAHGSRGMAIKLLDVDGPLLEAEHGAATQDFLMINQPVFAFANVEDYEVLSRVLVQHRDNPTQFFAERLPPQDATSLSPSQARAKETAGIVGRIRSVNAAFQVPPASPVDNDYFSAAPFMLGSSQVMRFRVRPVTRSTAEPNVCDPDYLRHALIERLRDKTAGDVVFHFEVQVRSADSIDPDVDIENASHGWPETDTCPYQPVATLTIPLQEFSSPEAEARCERLVFTPWHGLEAHKPLGGINRLRRAVYKASAMFRNLPKEPAAGMT